MLFHSMIATGNFEKIVLGFLPDCVIILLKWISSHLSEKRTI